MLDFVLLWVLQEYSFNSQFLFHPREKQKGNFAGFGEVIVIIEFENRANMILQIMVKEDN